MKKNIIVIIVAIAVLVIAGIFIYLIQTGKIKPRAAGEVATLALDPSSGTYNVGQSFDVNIILNTNGQAVDDVDIYHLHYDPAVLSVLDADNNSDNGVQIKQGSIFSTYTGNSVNTTTGEISLSGLDLGGQGYNGTGIFATINFKSLVQSPNTQVYFDFTLGSGTDCNVVQHGTAADILASVVNGFYTIAVPPLPPTVDILANSSDGPITIDAGSSATLSWGSTNANSCSASGDWSGDKPTIGSDTTGSISSTKTYILECSGAGGNAHDSVTVNVQTSSGGGTGDNGGTGGTGGTSKTTTTTPTTAPKAPSTSISKLPSNVQPQTTPSKTSVEVKNSAFKTWALWFLYAIIPAFLAGGAIYLYLKRRQKNKDDQAI